MLKPSATIEAEVHLNKFKLRPYQIPLWEALKKKKYLRAIAIWPRRAGKDVVAFNYVISCALSKVGVYFIVYPTYSQGRKILWDSMTNSGQRFLDFIPAELIESTNSTEMKIRLTNQSLIQVVGSDNYDSLVGTNPCGIVFSEYALQDPRAYQFLRPVLTANFGWAIFISTPRGKNSLYELYQIAISNPEHWYCSKLTVMDTGHISLHDIEREKHSGEMSDDLIQQEYFCFTPEQLVLMPNKLRPISEVKKDELVISHRGRLRRVLEVKSREYTGEIIEIKTYGSSEILRCTPNHPIRVYLPCAQSYHWKQAGEITPDDRLVFPKFHLGKYPVISYELCMLLAWFICDGSSCKNGLQFTINKNKSDRIESLLKTLKIPFRVDYKETVNNIVVGSVQMIDFFRSSCGNICYDKYIPFNLISTYEKDFFYELMKGDGCYSEKGKCCKFSFSTTSKTLAYQVQLLAHSLNLGLTAGIHKKKAGFATFPNGKTYATQESYAIQINIPKLRQVDSWLIRAKNGVAAKIISIERKQYCGQVCNLKVQYDESYLVHGRAVHNCSFDMGVEGAYYAKYIDKMKLDGRIGIVPYESGFKVHSCWDIGVRDSTSIIFFQCIGQTVRLIDCYENSKQGLEHYIKVMEQKANTQGWVWGRHFAPHDIAVREFGSGMTRIEKAKQLGVSFTITPNISIEDGIEALRSALGKFWIDETKCKQLIKALENYRQEWDEKKKVYKSCPLHNWSSHFSDSARYLAINLPKTRDGLSAEELDRRYQQAMYGSQGALPAAFRDPNEYY